jgi:hypothetical protein
MRKLAKLSLVAAVAVAGLTNVNAASLEEAIKGVDISGQFRYRYQDRTSDITAVDSAGESANGTDVEIEVGLKVPVTENVTAVFKIDNENNDGNAAQTKGPVEIEDYYFSYNQGALTVNAGQQNIPGRLTDGAQGDGIVALYNLGNATVGAAAFNNHNWGGTDLYSVIAMGTVGPVSLLGQYVDVADTLTSYNLKADASVEMVKVGAEYSETEMDSGLNKDERSTAIAYVSSKVGIVKGKLSYVKTGDNGSGSIHANASGSNASAIETPAEFLLWQMGSAAISDLSAFAIDASVAVTPKISLRAAYADGEHGAADEDISEALGQISYKVAKNLNTYLRYSKYEIGNTESTRGRVEVKYTF